MIEQYCTFELDGLYIGLEATRVQEVLRYQPVTHVPLAPFPIRGLMNLRGQIVLIIDLRRRLGLPDAPEHIRPVNVLIRAADGLSSLLVDRVGDVLEIDPDAFEPIPDTLDDATRALLRGAHQLPDRLLLRLDGERAVAL